MEREMNEMIKPVIVAVGYNRPHCMKRLLESIGKAEYKTDDITLVVSIDESNKSNEVEAVARRFVWSHGEKIIRRFPERQGLKYHIIQCGDLSEQYGAAIILEDDLYVSPGFYSYVCQAQEYYADNEKIAGVALYSNALNTFSQDRFIPTRNKYDTYLGQYSITWGQSWSSKQWKNFKKWFCENDGKLPAMNDKMPLEILKWTRSWGKYFISYMVEKDLYYVVPYTALSSNFSEQGEHNLDKGYENAYQVSLLQSSMEYRFPSFEEAVKYDSFFERQYDKEILPGVPGSDVCFDLYGMRVSPVGKNYLLSCKKYDFPIIKTFGLRMRPQEQNVIDGVEGDGIYLYKVNGDEKLYCGKRRKGSSELVAAKAKYEVQGLTRKVLFPHTIRLYQEAINRKIRKIFHKK